MLNILASFQSVLSTIGSIVLAFVILMLMVLIHETGHYLAGKLLKFKINEFSVGMGPKLFSRKKKNGEVFSLRLLPLGGYCAFEGEDSDVGTESPPQNQGNATADKNNPSENPFPEIAENSAETDGNIAKTHVGAENNDADTPAAQPVEGAFNAQKPWKRIIVLVSGAFFNFISAVLICIVLFTAYGETVAKVEYIYDYAPSSTQTLLEEGDIIYKINGRNVFVLDNITRYMPDDLTEEFSVTVLRDGDFVELNGLKRESFCSTSVKTISANYSDTTGERNLAVGDLIYKIESDGKTYNICQQGDIDTYRESFGETCLVYVATGNGRYVYEIKSAAFGSEGSSKIVVTETPYEGLGISISYQTHKFSFGTALSRVLPYCGEVAALVLRTLGGLFTGVVGLNDIGGPITTITVTSQVVQYGFASVLSLIVLISVNLAVFNLLPVPALDGCRIVFVLIEWIVGKPVNRKVEAWINGVGLILLFAFVILVDLLKWF